MTITQQDLENYKQEMKAHLVKYGFDDTFQYKLNRYSQMEYELSHPKESRETENWDYVKAQETYINKTDNILIETTEVFQTGHGSKQSFFEECLRKHGKCVGKLYEEVNGKRVPVGWIFEQNTDYYVLETRVKVFEN